MLGEILNALVGHQGKSNAEIAGEMGLGYLHERVLGYLRADNHTTAAKIAEDLDMSARQIERIIADLKAKGVIRRVGANKNGYWEVQD
jgi:predicted HTH transcriptional regulator